jgi:hypothetical protein
VALAVLSAAAAAAALGSALACVDRSARTLDSPVGVAAAVSLSTSNREA